METLDVVRAWKQPELRAHMATEHPVGEITLWQTGGLARRADLLSGHEALACSHTVETTVTTAVVEEEVLW
jgi:hypothetical protein